jgi:hypothetical protein
MPIKAVSTTPVKKILEESDPSGESWVMVLPASQRHEEQRGQHLKDRTIAYDERYGIVTKVNVNMATLWVEEIWILYGGAHIEIVDTDDGGKETTVMPFKPQGEMTYAEFKVAIDKLPKSVINEWHSKLVEVNDDWRLPF